jgi:DNA mismatch repair protein MutL
MKNILERYMQKIKQLPLHEAQKIAAGEVVERPANLIKELIENSLDANATLITLYIEQAGKNLIRVIDNGSGMSSEDARLCFYQHATSKINSVDELNTIHSFGFRGEALASIAAVSKLSIITREASSPTGIHLEIEKNQIIRQELVGGNPGTNITVRDLFYNVPARKKFLKKDETEWRQISQLFNALCLAHPHIHFKIFHDNRLIHNCPPVQTTMERATQLWDTMVQNHLISLKTQSNETTHIHGVITNHYFSRYDRNLIYIFVNNRWIKNFELSRALMKGYANVLQPGKFPAAALFISLPPDTVDINIHPRKEEVSLLHPLKVTRKITEIIKHALEENLSQQIKKTIDFKSIDSSFQNGSMPSAPFIPSANIPQVLEANHTTQLISQPTTNTFPSPKQFQVNHSSLSKTPSITQSSNISFDKKDFEGTIIGQVHKTYILIDTQEGLYFIDQHAAHERILYEQFNNKFHELPTIQLAFPQILDFPESDIQLLEPYMEVLINNGINLERFGNDKVIINATPVHCKRVNLKELIGQMIGWIAHEGTASPNKIKKGLNEHLHAQMACKSAIKAGDLLMHEQMTQLLKDLENTPNRFSCPHGRPTGWMMHWYDIEKKFKRKL